MIDMDISMVVMIASSILEGFVWSLSLTILLEPRFFSKPLTLLLMFLYTAIRNLIGDFFHYESYFTIIFYVINFAGIYLLYKGKMKDVFFMFAMLNLAMMFTEAVSFAVFGPGKISTLTASDSQLVIPKIIGNFFYPFFQVGYSIFLKQIISQWSQTIINKFYIYLISQPILAFLAMNIVYINHIEDGYVVIQEGELWFYRIGIVLFISIVYIYNFILFYYIHQEQNREMMEYHDEILKRNLQYYQERKMSVQHLRKCVHDAKNHLAVVESLINLNSEKAREYLEIVEKDISGL